MDIDKISNVLGYNDSKINKYIIGKINSLYPDIDSNNIDNDLLENIIQNIIIEYYNNINIIKNEMVTNIINISKINNDDNNLKNTNIDLQKNKFDLEIIKQNILMADEIIPEMSIPSNLIYLKGKLNRINTRIMIDTGASSCVIFKSVVDKCGLNYLVDTSTSVMVQGAHGMKPSLGTIWFVEIELEINQDKFVNIPISVEVIDDISTINANNIIKEHSDKITKIININDNNINTNTNQTNTNQTNTNQTNTNQTNTHEANTHEANTHEANTHEANTHGFEIILGMTFLKSYRANIDFSTMTITLNKNIKIKFN
jgi:hypothetical protein